MALIELEGMEFHAYHGCFKEEWIVGNSFIVNFSYEADTSIAEKSDNLADTVNYQAVYTMIKEEMAIPSHLLENVTSRILKKVCEHFPSINRAIIKISKLNPAMGGKIKCVSLTIEKKADEK